MEKKLALPETEWECSPMPPSRSHIGGIKYRLGASISGSQNCENRDNDNDLSNSSDLTLDWSSPSWMGLSFSFSQEIDFSWFLDDAEAGSIQTWAAKGTELADNNPEVTKLTDQSAAHSVAFFGQDYTATKSIAYNPPNTYVQKAHGATTSEFKAQSWYKIDAKTSESGIRAAHSRADLIADITITCDNVTYVSSTGQ